MANTVGTPGYIAQVQKMDTTTPAYGPTFDAIHQQLLNNDAFLNSEIIGLIQKAVNSGVIDYAGFFSNMGADQALGTIRTPVAANFSTYINQFGVQNFNAFLNGIKLIVSGFNNSNSATITGLNTIQLDSAPAANVTPSLPGSARDDLVFLEMWLDATTGAPKWRIRVVDGVDFSFATEGFYYAGSSTNNYLTVKPQGGNAAPIADTANAWCYAFRPANHMDLQGKFSDTGLYVAGRPDFAANCISMFNTLDGYVYAIPLFRVRRRNNAGFDPDNNPLGARDYCPPVNNVQATTTGVYTATLSNFGGGTSINNVQVGMWLNNGLNLWYQITAVNTATSTITVSTPLASFNNTWIVVSSLPDRPDGLYSNIIDASDITDLRHQVSLTGFNYQALLEKNLDLLLRGQLTTKEGTRYGRDYIGLNGGAGLPDDANTLLRCLFDGSINGTANGTAVTGAMNTGSASYVNGVQGQALAPSTSQYASYPVSIANGANTYSIEFLFKPNWNWNDNANHGLLSLANGSNNCLTIYKASNGNLNLVVGSVTAIINVALLPNLMNTILAGTWHKILITVSNGVVSAYIDGIAINVGYSAGSALTGFAYAVTTMNVAYDSLYNIFANAAIDNVRISNNVRTEQLLPSTFSAINGDRILDGPNGDFNQWSDDLGGISGVNGRTNPYGLSRVPNSIAARVNVNGSEIRHYYGNGFTPGWSSAVTGTPAITGSMGDYSGEYSFVNANETVDGVRTTFTFSQPPNVTGIPLVYNGNYAQNVQNPAGNPVAPASLTLNPSTGLWTATFGTAPASGSVVRVVYTTGARHAHFIPSTKGFVVHDWTDDSLVANGSQTVIQTSKYNVTSINHVRVTPNGGTAATIQNGGYSTNGLNAQTTLSANAASGATTLTVASGANFVAGQKIQISNGFGGWVSASISSISGTTIYLTAGLSAAVSQNAIVQGAAVFTFTTAPAASSTIDIVYESVYTPALGDYIRFFYQHTPYQGLLGTPNAGSGSYKFLYVDEDNSFITTIGSGANANNSNANNIPAWMKDYPVPLAQLPLNGYDYQLKRDTISFQHNPVTGAAAQLAFNEQVYEVNASNAANIYSPIAQSTPTSQINRGFSTSAVNDGASRQLVVALRDLASAVPHVCGMAIIAMDATTGELLLYVVTKYRTDVQNYIQIDGTSGAAVDVFKLQGRPLIKGYGGVAA